MMRPGTPGFIGSRLRAGREARDMSGAALAHEVDVTRSAISQYERGEQTPSPAVVGKISEVLDLPPHFFLKPEFSTERPVFYRSFSNALKRARIRAERKLEWLREIVDFLRVNVELPELKLPPRLTREQALSLSLDAIDDLAAQTRSFWGLGEGPLSNMVRLAENNGLIVSRHQLNSDRLDAFSFVEPATQTPYVILGKDKQCFVRSRFDAAHELGHVLLHSEITQEDMQDAERFKLIEAQANRFAGAFLLPASTFLSEVYSLTPDGLLTLKKRWGASVGLMAKRCGDLGVANNAIMRRLWIQIGKRGWRKSEPLDDELCVEQPVLLDRCFRLLLESGTTTVSQLLSILPWSPKELEELAAITPDLLRESELEAFEPTILRKTKFSTPSE